MTNRPKTTTSGLPPDNVMLSNANNPSRSRQTQHRRQNSTPTAFQGARVPNLNGASARQAAVHRRGQSLQMRRQRTAPPSTVRQDSSVSMSTNNPGLATSPQHHVVRETQQQRIQARPGSLYSYVSLPSEGHDGYLISPHATPHSQRFDTAIFDPAGASYDIFGGAPAMMQKGQDGYGVGDMSESRDFELFTADSPLSTPTFMNFHESPPAQGWLSEDETSNSRRPARRISGGLVDRVNKFENMAVGDVHRPFTPAGQNATNYLPPSPMETPSDRVVKYGPGSQRFSDGHDESMQETIRPGRNPPSRHIQTIFQEMNRQAEHQLAEPSPPQSADFPNPSCFNGGIQNPDFGAMNSFNNEFLSIQAGLDSRHFDAMNFGLPANHSEHASPRQSASQGASPTHMSPVMPYGNVHELSDVSRGRMFQSRASAHSSSSRPSTSEGSPLASGRGNHHRTDSIASAASAASIADIIIEETKTETGVTMDDINQYIQGPDPADGRWVCVFDDCGKKFGRKENIKSHVQTHLNDRQYQCPTCNKCFVRQHDLKRHAKIHSGVKPYPCECGNSFARHDALTRHRQRGMCVGAFDNVVRKVVKRGRPRKNRDGENGVQRSAQLNGRNTDTDESDSSQPGSPDGAAVSSLVKSFSMPDAMMMGMSMETQNASLTSMSSAPMPTFASHAGISSPSPQAASPHSYVSPEAIMENTPSYIPATPARSVASHNSPPELSRSNSPRPAHFFDSGVNTSAATMDLSIPAADPSGLTTDSMSGTLSMTLIDAETDMLLQFDDDAVFHELDREVNSLSMSKFDEEFDEDILDRDDGFFGQP